MATTADIILDSRIFLEDQSKDELIDEILRLRQEKETLEKELGELKKKLKPSFIKENGYKKKKRWKKLGRPSGIPAVPALPRIISIMSWSKPWIIVRTAAKAASSNCLRNWNGTFKKILFPRALK